jgi:hypothetical protein
VICGAKGVLGEFHPVVVGGSPSVPNLERSQKARGSPRLEARFLMPNAEEVTDVLLLPDGHGQGM